MINLTILISFGSIPLKIIRRTVSWGVDVIFLRNRFYFYSRYYGCDWPIVLFIKNIINPSHFVKKLRYGTVSGFPDGWLKGELVNNGLLNETSQLAAQLKRDGFVIMPNLHPQMADHLLGKYENFFNSVNPSDHYHDLILRDIDQEILEFLVKQEHIQIISEYYNGRQPYLRATGSLKVTDPVFPTSHTRHQNGNSKFNTNWHFDTANMVQIHFLLHDLTADDTHMKLAKGGHRKHRINTKTCDYYYSDEYVSDHYSVMPVCGKKGTVFIWDSNALHRAHLVVGHPRSFLQLLYSPGNDILTLDPRYGGQWGIAPGNLELEKLSPLSRGVLRYVMDDRSPELKMQESKNREGIQFNVNHSNKNEVSNF